MGSAYKEGVQTHHKQICPLVQRFKSKQLDQWSYEVPREDPATGGVTDLARAPHLPFIEPAMTKYMKESHPLLKHLSSLGSGWFYCPDCVKPVIFSRRIPSRASEKAIKELKESEKDDHLSGHLPNTLGR